MDQSFTVGYTTGVFDLFHIGHVNILRNAKSMCDKLIVGVTTDDLLINYKHRRSIIPFNERIEIIRNCKYVDLAVSQEDMDKFGAWKKYQFDVMFVGDDWFKTDKWNNIEEKLEEVGVKIIYFPYFKGTSTTKINEILVKTRKRLMGESVESK